MTRSSDHDGFAALGQAQPVANAVTAEGGAW